MDPPLPDLPPELSLPPELPLESSPRDQHFVPGLPDVESGGNDAPIPTSVIASPGSPAPPRRRRWFSYSIRSILLVQLLMGAALLPVGRQLYDFRCQQQFIAENKKFFYSIQTEPAPNQWLWRWLARATGTKAENITAFRLPKLSEEQAQLLLHSPRLQSVALYHGVESHRVLPILLRSPSLKQLELGDRAHVIDDRCLNSVPIAPRLESLALYSSKPTDLSIGPLGGKLPALKTLVIPRVVVTRNGIRPWYRHPQLTTFRCGAELNTFDAFEITHTWKTLRHLRIESTTPEGIEYLGNASQLETFETRARIFRRINDPNALHR